MAKIAEGDMAPGFTAKNHEGKEISLSDFKGRKVILYFYPKDDTPGCTAEACNLRDNYSELVKYGFEVIGVSPDDEKSHAKFKSRHNLPFHLIADKEAKIIKAYNAWGEKKMYGKSYMGVLRTTYIIDEQGKIIRVIAKVNTAGHARQILEELGLK